MLLHFFWTISVTYKFLMSLNYAVNYGHLYIERFVILEFFQSTITPTKEYSLSIWSNFTSFYLIALKTRCSISSRKRSLDLFIDSSDLSKKVKFCILFKKFPLNFVILTFYGISSFYNCGALMQFQEQSSSRIQVVVTIVYFDDIFEKVKN